MVTTLDGVSDLRRFACQEESDDGDEEFNVAETEDEDESEGSSDDESLVESDEGDDESVYSDDDSGMDWDELEEEARECVTLCASGCCAFHMGCFDTGRIVRASFQTTRTGGRSARRVVVEGGRRPLPSANVEVSSCLIADTLDGCCLRLLVMQLLMCESTRACH